MHTISDQIKKTPSTQALLDRSDDDAPLTTDMGSEADIPHQKGTLPAPVTCIDYDDKTLRIWDERYKSLRGFAHYVGHCLILGWIECSRISAWLWRKSWTAEVCSFAFALVSLMGLVLVLSKHQGKPIPEWPQLITINSVVSLFALFMRIGVGVVLAEGKICRK